MIGIYKITSPTGKIYIGQSIDIEKRWRDHKSSPDSPKLRNSIKKHGFENHKFEVEEECEVELLNERERHYQDLYDVLSPNGLNLILTTTETKSGYMSEEVRQNLRIKATDRRHSPETIEKIRLNSLNMSEETRDKIRRTLQGTKRDPESISKAVEKNTGKKRSKETRDRMSKEKVDASYNKKKVINTETKEIFNSITSAAKSIGIRMEYLSDMLLVKRKNITSFEYYINN